MAHLPRLLTSEYKIISNNDIYCTVPRLKVILRKTWGIEVGVVTEQFITVSLSQNGDKINMFWKFLRVKNAGIIGFLAWGIS